MKPQRPDGWRSTPRPKGWQRTRQRILRRDGGRCRLCGKPANAVDHIIPASQGGTDDDGNLAAICSSCHGRKTAQEANARNPRAQPRRRQEETHPGTIAPQTETRE